MPSWKKVITSGSDAGLKSLHSTGPITGSDVKIGEWGSVSASLATFNSSINGLDNYVEWNLAGEADTTDVTSGKFVKFTGGQSITGTGTESDPYVMTIVPTSLGGTTTIDSSTNAQLILDRNATSNDSEIILKTNGTTDWTIGTGQVGSDSEFIFKGSNGSNYIRIAQTGNTTFSSQVTASAVTAVSSSIDHLVISDEYRVNGIIYRVYENTNVNAGETVVATFPTGEGYAAHFDYLIRTNFDYRAGKIVIIQNGSSINITDTSTTDIGFTGGVVFDVRINTGGSTHIVELVMVSDSSGWSFKSDCKII